jgi:hypothetical protein
MRVRGLPGAEHSTFIRQRRLRFCSLRRLLNARAAVWARRCLGARSKVLRNDFEAVLAFIHVSEFFVRLTIQKVDRAEPPLKVWKECLHCQKFPSCGENALTLLSPKKPFPSLSPSTKPVFFHSAESRSKPYHKSRGPKGTCVSYITDSVKNAALGKTFLVIHPISVS